MKTPKPKPSTPPTRASFRGQTWTRDGDEIAGESLPIYVRAVVTGAGAGHLLERAAALRVGESFRVPLPFGGPLYTRTS